MTAVSIVLISLLPFAALRLAIVLLVYTPQKIGKASVALSVVSAFLTFLMIPIVTLTPTSIYLGFRSWRIEKEAIAQDAAVVETWHSTLPM